jgi:ACR3 family arsenite efflux pump ArsB
LPAAQIDSYIAGLILLAAAPCTAMVFVWSNLTDGEPHFTLSQVALNDLIMVFAFAPIVGATKLQHLTEAAAALAVKLPAEEIARLEAPYRPHPIAGF